MQYVLVGTNITGCLLMFFLINLYQCIHVLHSRAAYYSTNLRDMNTNLLIVSNDTQGYKMNSTELIHHRNLIPASHIPSGHISYYVTGNQSMPSDDHVFLSSLTSCIWIIHCKVNLQPSIQYIYTICCRQTISYDEVCVFTIRYVMHTCLINYGRTLRSINYRVFVFWFLRAVK